MYSILGEMLHQEYLEYDPNRVYIDGVESDNEYDDVGGEEDEEIIYAVNRLKRRHRELVVAKNSFIITGCYKLVVHVVVRVTKI